MRLINSQYSKAIKENKLLTKAEEMDLSRKAKKGNKRARQKLVESNYRLAISMAKKYHRQGTSFEDLLQESVVGLLKAVDKFDPELGYKFSTYACWWIKQAILQFVNESSTDIKVPTHSRLLNQKIKKKIAEIENETGTAPSVEVLSEQLGETVKKINYTLKANKHITSLDSLIEINNSTGQASLKVQIKDSSDYVNPEKSLERKELKEIIYKSLSLLTPKEEKIIRLRFGIGEEEDNVENFPVTKEMKEYLNEK